MNKNKKSQKVESKSTEFNPKQFEKNGFTEDEVNGNQRSIRSLQFRQSWPN